MIFNFTQKRANKKTNQQTSGQAGAAEGAFASSPEGEGRGAHCGCGSGDSGDVAGASVAFGPVYAPLSDMEVGGRGVLGEFDVPEHVAEQLMNLGFVPGMEVMVAQSGPGGDPRVYRVDGAEVALRGDLAKLIAVAPALEAASERTLSLRDQGAAPTLRAPTPEERQAKRSSVRCAKDGAPLSANRRERAAVGLSTQEASAD